MNSYVRNGLAAGVFIFALATPEYTENSYQKIPQAVINELKEVQVVFPDFNHLIVRKVADDLTISIVFSNIASCLENKKIPKPIFERALEEVVRQCPFSREEYGYQGWIAEQKAIDIVKKYAPYIPTPKTQEACPSCYHLDRT